MLTIQIYFCWSYYDIDHPLLVPLEITSTDTSDPMPTTLTISPGFEFEFDCIILFPLIFVRVVTPEDSEIE